MICFVVGCGPRSLRGDLTVAGEASTWGFDTMFDCMSFVTVHPFAAPDVAPAPRRRGRFLCWVGPGFGAEAADELDRERAAEFERELAFEMNGDRRPGQEDEETRADIEPARALRVRWARLA